MSLHSVFRFILHQSKHLTGHCYEHSPHMVSHYITTIQSCRRCCQHTLSLTFDFSIIIIETNKEKDFKLNSIQNDSTVVASVKSRDGQCLAKLENTIKK